MSSVANLFTRMSGPSERSYNRPIIAVSIKIVHLFRRCTYYPESMVYNHFITLLKEDVSIKDHILCVIYMACDPLYSCLCQSIKVTYAHLVW